MREQARDYVMNIFQKKGDPFTDRSSGKRVMRDVVGKRQDAAPFSPAVKQSEAEPPKKEELRLPQKPKHAASFLRGRFAPSRVSGRLSSYIGGLFRRTGRIKEHKNISGETKTPFHRRWSRAHFVGTGLAALLLALFGVYVFSSVSVSITPRQEGRQVAATLRAGTADGVVIPAEIMRISQPISGSVPTSGEELVHERARGTIIIYNAFSSEAQALVRRTRFAAPDGKIYRMEQAITVPGVRVEDGKVVPGSAEAEVMADEPGPAYNKDLVDLTVPGFAGTPRFEKFYARSKTPMSGGFNGVAKIATQEDAVQLRNKLEEELRTQLLARAEAQTPDGFLRFPDAQDVVLKVRKANPDVGRAGEELLMELEGTLTAFLIREQDFTKALAKDLFTDGLEKGIVNLDDLQIKVVTRNFDTEEIVLAVDGEAYFVWRTADDAVLKRELAAAGNAYESVFRKYPAIVRAEIDFSPSWWRLFPKKEKDISIERIITR